VLTVAALGVLMSNAAVPEAQTPTPTPVDAFITMNGNPVGTQVSPAVMRTGTIGFTGGNWTVNDSSTAIKVGPSHFNLPGPIKVGSTTYPIDYPTQSMAYDSFYNFNDMQANFPDNTWSKVTAAGYFTFGIPNQGGSGSLSDLVRIDLTSGAYAVFQLRNGNAPGYAVNIETDANGTVHSPNITVVPGSTVWYCLKADFGAGRAFLNVYDVPGFNLLGSVSKETKRGSNLEFVRIGNGEEAQGDHSHFNYFEDTLFDWTNAAFPLLPTSSGTVPTAPTNLRIVPL